MNIRKTLFFVAVLALFGCHERPEQSLKPAEDVLAKKMLQGIWVSDEEGVVFFKVVKDSIFYPDTTSVPVHFYIIGDTLMLEGDKVSKYAIVKQSAHVFQFRNQSGDLVSLVKSDDPVYKSMFGNKRPQVLNQNVVIKNDTVVFYQNERYHCYMQVNPTTYKVYKSVVNNDGVEVENIYHDNTVHLSIFNGTRKVFSREFRKQDFVRLISDRMLRQSILNDLTFDKVDANGFHFYALVGIPDNASNYAVKLTISFDGKLNMSL